VKTQNEYNLSEINSSWKASFRKLLHAAEMKKEIFLDIIYYYISFWLSRGVPVYIFLISKEWLHIFKMRWYRAYWFFLVSAFPSEEFWERSQKVLRWWISFDISWNEINLVIWWLNDRSFLSSCLSCAEANDTWNIIRGVHLEQYW